MFDWGFLQGFASCITLIGFAWAIYGSLGNKRNCVYAAHASECLIPFIFEQGIQVSVKAGEVDGRQLYCDYLLLCNRTKKNLTAASYVERPSIEIIQSRKIYESKVEIARGSGYVELQETNEAINIKNLDLPSGSGIIVKVLHDGCLAKFNKGRLEEEGRIRDYSSLTFLERKVLHNAPLFAALTVSLASIFEISLGSQLEIPSERLTSILISLVLIFLVSSIFFVRSIKRRELKRWTLAGSDIREWRSSFWTRLPIEISFFERSGMHLV